MLPLGIPDPPATISHWSPFVMLVVWASIATLAFVWAISIGLRKGEWIALATAIGGAICSMNEVQFDWLGKIVYADNLYSAYTVFDRQLPIQVVLGYIPWVGFAPFFFAMAMRRGVKRSRLLLIGLAAVVVMFAEELFIFTPVHAWTYYAEPPLQYLGVTPMMAPYMLVTGLILYLAMETLSGWRKFLVGVWAPVIGLPLTWAVSGWPMYNALHSDVSKPVEWFAGLLTIGLCAAIAVCAVQIYHLFRVTQQRRGLAAGLPDLTTRELADMTTSKGEAV